MSLTEAKMSSLKDKHLAQEQAAEQDTLTPKAVNKKGRKLGDKKKGKKYE